MAEISYARNGDQHIAYRVTGDGPIDAVFVSNWLSDVEAGFDIPATAPAIPLWAEYMRTVWFDQPGTGHSDPIFGEMPSLETFADSIRVVMDAAEMKRAALIVWDLGTPAAILFAATHPGRVSALVTVGGTARWLADDGYSGIAPDVVDQVVEWIGGNWGKREHALFNSPSMAGDEESIEAVSRWMRHSLSPGMARRIFAMALRFDVRELLPLVSCPTLVLQSTRAAAGNMAYATYLADHIPNARLETFDTADHMPYQRDHLDWMLDTTQEFLTGERPPAAVDDRVLATVLYTDFVASTEKASAMGDRAWRELLERHDDAARREIERFRGRLVKTTGDGVLATFDGPARAIRCAIALREAALKLGIETRAGLHTGEIELRDDDIAGVAAHIGARVSAMAGPGEVLTSSTVKDLVVGSGIEFDDRGSHALKGVPDEWRIYAVKE